MVVHLSAFYSREQRRHVLPSDARVAAMVQPRDGEILIREELRLGIACGPAQTGNPEGNMTNSVGGLTRGLRGQAR